MIRFPLKTYITDLSYFYYTPDNLLLSYEYKGVQEYSFLIVIVSTNNLLFRALKSYKDVLLFAYSIEAAPIWPWVLAPKANISKEV